MDVSRVWLLLSVPLLAAAAIGLALTIRRLVALSRRSVLLSVPVIREQQVELPVGGTLSLNIEGQFLDSLGNLTYALFDENGSSVRLSSIVGRARTSSFTRARLELLAFHLAAPARLTLRISGFDPDRDYSRNRVVFTRRMTGRLVAHILVLVTLALVTVGSVVLTVLVLVTGGESRV